MSAMVSRRMLLGMAGGVLVVPIASRIASAQQATGPVAPIGRLDGALMAAMKAGPTTPFARRYQMLEPVIVDVYDLDAVLAASVGPSYFTMSAAQKAALAAAFRRYTVATYTSSFDSYNGQSFRILPGLRRLPDGRVIVQTQFVPRSGSPKALNYVMKQSASRWQAVDVLADGSISRVATQRADFADLLASGGAPALIAGLERKVSTLSGEAAGHFNDRVTWSGNEAG